MNIKDLEHIFQPQLAEGTTSLYFMLEDAGHKMIERHDAVDMSALLPMLDSFQYSGTTGRVPRFVK